MLVVSYISAYTITYTHPFANSTFDGATNMTSIQTTNNDTYELVSVDAWSDGESYVWNAWYKQGYEMLYVEVPRTVETFLQFLIDKGIFAEWVKVSEFALKYSVEVDNNCENGNVTLYRLPEPRDEENEEETDEEELLHAPEPVFAFIYKG